MYCLPYSLVVVRKKEKQRYKYSKGAVVYNYKIIESVSSVLRCASTIWLRIISLRQLMRIMHMQKVNPREVRDMRCDAYIGYIYARHIFICGLSPLFGWLIFILGAELSERDWRFELAYNTGVQLLHTGKPAEALQSLTRALPVRLNQ